MSATMQEAPVTRTGISSPTTLAGTYDYVVMGASDQFDAMATVIAGTDLTKDGGNVTRQQVEAKELDAQQGIYDVKVTYASPNSSPKQTGETAFNFDTTGGTTKVTHSIATVASFAADDGDPPDLKGAINVHDKKVDGVEITIPNLAFTGTRYVSSLSETYIGQLFHATGAMNSGDLTMVIDGITLQFTEGEVLALGANGSKRGQGDVELSLKFAASETETNITIGDITGINKRGWDYLWVFSVDGEVPGQDEDGNDVTYVAPVPTYVYVEQLYPLTAFSVFGFPTS